MDAEKYVDMEFPVNGIDRSMELQLQSSNSTPLALNVRGYEPGTLRLRGGGRAGVAKYVPAQLPSGNHVIQMLDYIVDPQGTALLTGADSFGPTAPGIYITDPSSNNGGPGGGFGIVTGNVVLAGGQVTGGITPLPFTTGLGPRNPGRVILNGGSGIAPNRKVFTQGGLTGTLRTSAVFANTGGVPNVTLTARLIKGGVYQVGKIVTFFTTPFGRPGDNASAVTDSTGTATLAVYDTTAETIVYSAVDSSDIYTIPNTVTVTYQAVGTSVAMLQSEGGSLSGPASVYGTELDVTYSETVTAGSLTVAVVDYNSADATPTASGLAAITGYIPTPPPTPPDVRVYLGGATPGQTVQSFVSGSSQNGMTVNVFEFSYTGPIGAALVLAVNRINGLA